MSKPATTALLVRNRVKDYTVWRRYLEQDSVVAAAYGITLAHIWQSADDPQEVFFVLNIEDRSRADAFMARPESVRIGELSGVLDGEVHYLTTASHPAPNAEAKHV